jgi:predicted transcriptional regulator
MVQLSGDLVEALDRHAARAGVSRSQVIRDAVEAFLASDRAATIDRQIVGGYIKTPQGGEFDVDEWGDLSAMMPTLTADQQKQLTAEERARGVEPW